MSERSCQLIAPIKIDFSFAEVSAVFCFDIRGKKFIRNPKGLDGSIGAFVHYKYNEDKIPHPTPFIKVMHITFT